MTSQFPHGVLEVKLQLAGNQETPSWVGDLLETGMLVEVNKFGKFVHGFAALLPASKVKELPYWFHQVNLVDEEEEEGAKVREQEPAYKSDKKGKEKKGKPDEQAALLPPPRAFAPPEPTFLEHVAKLFLSWSAPTAFQKVVHGKLVVEPKVMLGSHALRRGPVAPSVLSRSAGG